MSSATGSSSPPSSGALAPAASSETPAAQTGLPADWAKLAPHTGGGYVADALGESAKVESGHVFEVARIAVPDGVTKLVVPKSAKVKNDAPSGALFVVTKKTLHFKGHPAAPMPLEGLRANMGCATKTERNALLLGTFGEWSSKEGGVEQVVVVRAPPSLKVTRRDDLEGASSVANGGTGKPLGAWFGSSGPSAGWERVTLEMDPRHIADKP